MCSFVVRGSTESPSKEPPSNKHVEEEGAAFNEASLSKEAARIDSDVRGGQEEHHSTKDAKEDHLPAVDRESEPIEARNEQPRQLDLPPDTQVPALNMPIVTVGKPSNTGQCKLEFEAHYCSCVQCISFHQGRLRFCMRSPGE